MKKLSQFSQEDVDTIACLSKIIKMQHIINDSFILSLKSTEKRLTRVERMVEALADDLFQNGHTDEPFGNGMSGISWEKNNDI